MRVTTENQYSHTIQSIQQKYAKLTQLQNELSSGSRLQAASDDPAAMSQVMQNNVLNARYTTDLSTIATANTNIQAGVDTLTQIQGVLTSVRTMALQANNVTTPQATNDTLADQVNAAINQLVQLSNQQLPDGTYIFGGASSTTPPFTVSGTDSSGQPTSISYDGSQHDSEAIVSKSMTVTTLIAGSDVLQSSNRGATVYTGSTGAVAGSGTDSAIGQGTLQVQHTLTTLAVGSGVSAGTSSAASDTIIGPAGANSLQINDTSGDGSSGTVSLNGGPAVSYTNSDTDLKVTGPDGEVVYVNTTAITAGYQGSISLTADGTLSTDGGKTSVPIDFSGNQTVINGSTGAVTNVDSSNIRQAGTDQLDYQGTSDVFQALINLRDTIANTQGLSASDRSTLLAQQIKELDRQTSSVSKVIGAQSAQAQALSNLKDHLTQVQLDLNQSTDNLQSVDTATAVVQLQQTMNLYQAALQIASQLNHLTLADYIH